MKLHLVYLNLFFWNVLSLKSFRESDGISELFHKNQQSKRLNKRYSSNPFKNQGQNHENFNNFDPQKPDYDFGQGQAHQELTDEGQKYEDIDFGQSASQNWDNLDFEEKKPSGGGQTYENLDFGQKPDTNDLWGNSENGKNGGKQNQDEIEMVKPEKGSEPKPPHKVQTPKPDRIYFDINDFESERNKDKECLAKPPSPEKAVLNCQTKERCTLTCVDGYLFPDGYKTVMLECRNEKWISNHTDQTSNNLECNPTCNPPCLNGGKCLDFNVCECPVQYAGIHCQYEQSACDFHNKFSFDGKINCTDDEDKFLCKIGCPEGSFLDSPGISEYSCYYSTGKWVPETPPKCIFVNTESSNGKLKPQDHFYESYYEKHDVGDCSTWQGSHYKTFDNELYSFTCNCSYVLVKDIVEDTFSIILGGTICNVPPCYRPFKLFYKDKEYILTRQGKSPILKLGNEIKSIPVLMPGLSIMRESDLILVSLEAEDVVLRWNGEDFYTVFIKSNLWNRTGGLCGKWNGFSSDDFYTKEDLPAQNIQTFIQSWKSESIGDDHECESTLETENSCPKSKSNSLSHCKSILKDPHFGECRKVINATKYYQACIWDECDCGKNCSCNSISAFVNECGKRITNPVPDWRNIVECPMNCEGDKIYNSCGPSVQATCGSFEKLETSVNKCHEGCFCPTGKVLHNDNCISKELCPCQWKNETYASGNKIAKGCNTCTCQAGKWICTEINCGKRCVSVGDPHYTTFDGKRYDFMGQCSYYLLKSEGYSIEAENLACSGFIGFPMTMFNSKFGAGSCTKALTIRYGENLIKLKQNKEISVNGIDVQLLPHQVNDLIIQAASSLYVIVTLPNKVQVWWDGKTTAYIDVPGELKGYTKGLCGTFNDNQKDDFLTPEGDVEESAIAFANKWKTEEKCTDIPESNPHPCDSNIENKATAEKYCKYLKDTMFSKGHLYVDVEPYYKDCLYDVCSCKGKASDCFCSILADYASQCALEGAIVDWRSTIRECGIHCEAGQVYQECGDSCTRSCRDISLYGNNCSKKCVEGCNCPSGQTLNSYGECIPINECFCIHHNNEYKPGEKIIMDEQNGHHQLCECENARWVCRPANFEETEHYNETIQMKIKCEEGEHQEFTLCEPAVPVTCKNMHEPQYSPRVCTPGCICKKGYVWDSIGKICVNASECPCHHGGISYADGQSIKEHCNTCKCKNGIWDCTKNDCPGICSVWGDSHFKTFDGRIYDFQGSCDFLLSSGQISDYEIFVISIQIVPCGSSGISCPKSISIKTGPKDSYEEVILKNPMPSTKDLKMIIVREAGLFVIAEILDLGVTVQWDKKTRVYVKVTPKWKNELTGLCGNFNDNEMDDFKTPTSGEMSEISATLFADSWRLQSYCPHTEDIVDTCSVRPERLTWAIKKCGILKSSDFQSCHATVPVEPYLDRCIVDTCGCDQGGDCECLCSAIAAYAHECTLNGIIINWRKQEFCPVQCENPVTHYTACTSTCPLRTCENQYLYSALIPFCTHDTCVEGCEGNSCPPGEIFSDSSLKKCIPISSCSRVCLIRDNRVYYEGDVMEDDDCQTCYCSRNEKVCLGKYCSAATENPIMIIPTELKPIKDDNETLCISGWSSWINRNHPNKYHGNDVERIPTLTELHSFKSRVICDPDEIVDIECRQVNNHSHYVSDGHSLKCNTLYGLQCLNSTGVCPDYEIRVYCQCSVKTTSAEPTEATAVCPPNETWDDCIVPCDHICHSFRSTAMKHYDICSDQDNCVKGCRKRDLECPKGSFLRDTESCVLKKDCTCASPSGVFVKPGHPKVESDCETCLCLDNNYECIRTCTNIPPTIKSIVKNETFLPTTQTEIFITPTISSLPACLNAQYESLINSKTRFTASSSKTVASDETSANILDNGVWTAGVENADQYLQVDLGRSEPIYAVSVAGNPNGNHVTRYFLLYSNDGKRFTYSANHEGLPEIFMGPASGFEFVKETLPSPIEARYIRFSPLSWHDGISMKIDILGCSEGSTQAPTEETILDLCTTFVGVGGPYLPFSHVSVSSVKSGYDVPFITLDSDKGWEPLSNSQSEWVMVNLNQERILSGIVTKGIAGDNNAVESWIDRFKLVYSNDELSWNPIKDDFGNEKIFTGNHNGNGPKYNYFKVPIRSKYVKLIPINWHNNIALRLDVISCDNVEPVIITTGPPVKVINKCNVCGGVENNNNPNEICMCEEDKYWDGENCVNHSHCPCFFNHVSYPVGTTFKAENCQECVCRFYGIPNCQPKECKECPPGHQKILTPYCGCTCKPCPEKFRLCPTSNVCLEEEFWCDKIQDCPDDEINCTEPTLPPKESGISCKPTCSPGYRIVYHKSKVSSASHLNYKSEYFSNQKSVKGYETGEKVKKNSCDLYYCVPNGKRCEVPSCSPNHKIVAHGNGKGIKGIKTKCQEYSCQPIPVFASCNVTSSSIHTFDGYKLQYEICNHVLLKDLLKQGKWEVKAIKSCKQHIPCMNVIDIKHGDHHVLLYPESKSITLDGFDYTFDQILLAKNVNFSFHLLGDSHVFVSKLYNFEIIFDKEFNIQIKLPEGMKNKAYGLCGLFNGFPEDDKTLPNGDTVKTNIEFGDGWMNPDAEECERRFCPQETQKVAFEVCSALKKAPFNFCSIMKNEQPVIHCVESVCNCIASNKSLEDCRCTALSDFASVCKSKELIGWRLMHNCPAICPPHLVYHDCYPYSCEPSCNNENCIGASDVCFSGCFCPDGFLRKGDQCIKPYECRDCICNGYGDSHYVTFDRRDFTFNGNCTYVASRDITPSGIFNFQVLITNQPCTDNKFMTCTNKIDIDVKGHSISLVSLTDEKKVAVFVDQKLLTKNQIPFFDDWANIEEIPGTYSVYVKLPSYHLEIRYYYRRFAFTITVPSYYYKNQIEGLCGNCNQNQLDDFDEEQSVDSWLVNNDPESCKIPEPKECPEIPFKSGDCSVITDKDVFGKCHAIVNPEPFVKLCHLQLCHKEPLCHVLAAYSQACRDVGICVDWRKNGICPYFCPTGFEYHACELGCVKTCENYLSINETCDRPLVEGCFCKPNQILLGSNCVSDLHCKTCDEKGHRHGETWQEDSCSNCTCHGSVKTCTKTECPMPNLICGKDEIITTEPYLQDKCCPKHICVCKPREECEKIIRSENLPPGMHEYLDDSNCCPHLETQCRPETCPPPKPCKEHYVQKMINNTVDCCPQYSCEKPHNVCLFEYQIDGGPKGAESRVAIKLVGDRWIDGPCKSCVCIIIEGSPQAVCSVTNCMNMQQHPDYNDYVLENMNTPDRCCPEYVRVGCKDNGKQYEIGDTWTPAAKDHCKTIKCAKNENGLVEKTIYSTICNTNCDYGQEYVKSNNSCCGQCVQAGCVLYGNVYRAGDTWYSDDKCTTYSCKIVDNAFVVTTYEETCPSLTNCPEENIFEDKCCKRCNLTNISYKSCILMKIPEKKTINMVNDVEPFHGKCTNSDPIPNLTECYGGCESRAVFKADTRSYENVCRCCQIVDYTSIIVPLLCEDGLTIEKNVTIASKCLCQNCSG